MLSDGVHVLCVTTDAANAAVPIDMFASGATAIATVLSDGVHVLAATDTPDSGFAVSSFASGKSVIASAVTDGVHSLALSGLAPPFDPEALAYFNAAGITYPSDQATAINAFIIAARAAVGVSALSDFFDRIWILGNQNAAAALTDVLLNGLATAVNGPTFTPYIGYVGDGATQYLDLGWAPADGINFQQNDCAYSVYVNNNIQSDNWSFGTVYRTAAIFRRLNGYGLFFINDTVSNYIGVAASSASMSRAVLPQRQRDFCSRRHDRRRHPNVGHSIDDALVWLGGL